MYPILYCTFLIFLPPTMETTSNTQQPAMTRIVEWFESSTIDVVTRVESATRFKRATRHPPKPNWVRVGRAWQFNLESGVGLGGQGNVFAGPGRARVNSWAGSGRVLVLVICTCNIVHACSTLIKFSHSPLQLAGSKIVIFYMRLRQFSFGRFLLCWIIPSKLIYFFINQNGSII